MTLIDRVASFATEHGCRRLWLITTNDNLPAQRFYERSGFRLTATHQGAVALSRLLKPEIPVIGIGGVQITDALEYERDLVEPHGG